MIRLPSWRGPYRSRVPAIFSSGGAMNKRPHDKRIT